MTQGRAQQFADSLQRLEQDGDIEKFVDDAFGGDPELHRPERRGQQLSGRAGALDFWREYLGFFDEVHSEFSRVTDSGDLGVLEWTSSGSVNGRPVTYDGVSILDFDADGQVRRFATYYDTAPFVSASS